MTAGWNFADTWEHLAHRFPDAPAQAQGERRTTWQQFERRADGVAGTLLAATAAAHQDKVALYLYNCPEYLECVFGCFKAGLVPVNTNYRYTDDELVYLWDNADAVAVVFHGTFVPTVERLRDRLPVIRAWLWVDDGHHPKPAWAIDYEEAAASRSATGDRTMPIGLGQADSRSGDDLLILYTGGTTGMPKGVMWRQDDVFATLDAATRNRLPVGPGWDALDEKVTRPGHRVIPAAPLMHGTGLFNAMSVLMAAGSVVTTVGRSFDPVELLDTVQRERVTTMSIVGDAFAKPILRALDAEPQRWDVSSLRVMVSSGVMWSEATKQGLLAHAPRLVMVDTLGSTEAIGMASSVSRKEGDEVATSSTATFRLNADTCVLTEDGREVQPGSGELGRLALRGRTPLGYYKDPQKSASTFAVINGVRYSIPGDWAEVEADGTVRLLGRGSQCINTGGEKVYPEEVEEVLKHHPSVADAVVVGVPDERFGEAITALVEPQPGHGVDEAALIAHVRAHLAAYKAPKRVHAITTVGRAPNGKVDYKRLKAEAIART